MKLSHDEAKIEVFNEMKAELEQDLAQKENEYNDTIKRRIKLIMMNDFASYLNRQQQDYNEELNDLYIKENELEKEIRTLNNKLYKLEEFGCRYIKN